MSEWKYDLAVIGIGRVGLPLALLFAAKGLRVLGVDRDEWIIKAVRGRQMPFEEQGCQPLLDEGVTIDTTFDAAECAYAEKIVITVGTPFTEHIEMNLGHLNEALKSLIPALHPGQTIILRSTVAVGTTEFVKRRIESERGWKVGEEFFLAFAPERILEGKALEELATLPQPIGAEDAGSFAAADALFRVIAPEIFHVTFRGAELVKLFCNTGRYVYFALVNYFFMVANKFGEDIYELLEVTNKHYPRPILYSPGFAGGPCLRKDFAMISELFPQSDLFTAAWRINESLPKTLVEEVKTRMDLGDKRVAVLGFTFKKDSDDFRDSLVPKLLRYLLREVPESIKVSEPNIAGDEPLDCGYFQFPNHSAEEAVEGADVVIIANNHSAFDESWDVLLEKIPPGALIVDVWNMTGRGKMFYQTA
ncbi:nucleotide sugar dehydrogenase [Endothiovibrio diazotrophicus]